MGRGLPTLDGIVLNRVQDLKARHDLAGGEQPDLERAVGELGDRLAEELRTTVERVERLREA